MSNFAKCLAIGIGAETPESSHYQPGDLEQYMFSLQELS